MRLHHRFPTHTHTHISNLKLIGPPLPLANSRAWSFRANGVALCHLSSLLFLGKAHTWRERRGFEFPHVHTCTHTYTLSCEACKAIGPNSRLANRNAYVQKASVWALWHVSRCLIERESSQNISLQYGIWKSKWEREGFSISHIIGSLSGWPMRLALWNKQVCEDHDKCLRT